MSQPPRCTIPGGMLNDYAGRCARCGKRLAAGEGVLMRGRRNALVLFCQAHPERYPPQGPRPEPQERPDHGERL